MIVVFVDSAAVCAPGLPHWDSARAVLTGATPYQPGPLPPAAPSLLPPAERRRAGATVRLALAVAQETIARAGAAPEDVATVFTSSDGDGENIHYICESLAAAAREISPTRFHNSVHNTAAGYWSIATGCRAPSNSVGGFDTAFARGLFDAAAQASIDARRVLLVAYDLPMPAPLYATRPLAAACAVGLLLSPAAHASSAMRLELDLIAAGTVPASVMPDAGLEELRRGNPAARALPLLSALAGRDHAEVVLEYGGSDLRLRVDAVESSRAAATPRAGKHS
jgi:hypothetical protein